MKTNIQNFRVQYITDIDANISYEEQVEAVCQGGIKWVQLRMKEASKADFLSKAIVIKEICRQYNAIFIINDNVEIAKTVDADGVHLGKKDICPLEARKILGAEKIIGATCNTFQDIERNYQKRVDYFGVGPFRTTTTKKVLSPILGLSEYEALMLKMKEKDIQIPIYAIGGITSEDIAPLLKMGIHGIALSSYIKNSPSMTLKSEEIIQQIDVSV